MELEIGKVKYLIVHCSDTDHPDHDNIEMIRHWHVAGNGWSDIGYHYFIDKKGNIITGRSLNLVGAHTKGVNSVSIGVCLSGKRNFTAKQYFALGQLKEGLSIIYGGLKMKPHNYFNNNKTCPNVELNWD